MSKTRLNIPSLLGVLSFILPLAVYTIFACPTVAAGDSGELITAAFTLGVAHPPGYPLFCLLGKGMTYLPLSNIAFRVNLLAGLFGALSVWMLFLLLKRLLSFLNEGKAVIISFFTVLAVGFSALFFEQAMHAKGSLYTLNVFLIITLMYSVLSGRSPLLSGFIAGLSMANHHTALTFCGMLFLYQVFVSKEKVKSGAIFLGSALLTAVAIYMYLPLAANTNPPINWGNPKDLESALFHIFRIQYGEARMPLTVLVYLKKLWPYAGIIFSQLSLFSLLALPGLYLLYKKNRNVFLLTVFSFAAFYFPLLHKVDHNLTPHLFYVNRVFLLPLTALLAIWCAFGFAFVLERFSKAKILILLPAVLPLLIFSLNHSTAGRSNSFLLYDYGVNTFRSLEKNAVLFTAGDHSAFIAVYLKEVEKVRPDLAFIDDTGSVFENIYGADFLKMQKGLHEQRLNDVQMRYLYSTARPVYFVMGCNIQNMALFNKALTYKPFGLVYELTGTEKTRYSRKDIWPDLKFRNLQPFKSGDYLEQDLASQILFMQGEAAYYRGNIKEADRLYDASIKAGKDVDTMQNNMNVVFMRPEFKDKMLKFAKDTVARNPYLADAHTNMGNAYIYINEYDNAIASYKRSLEIDPKSEQTWHNLGIAYLKKESIAEAAECFKKSIELYPVVPNDFSNLVDCYVKLNRLDDALNVAYTGIKFHPNDIQIRSNAGNILLKAERYEEALQNYGFIIEKLNPDIPDVYNNMGVALIRLKRVAESEQYFNRAVQLNPNYTAAKKNLNDVREFLKRK